MEDTLTIGDVVLSAKGHDSGSYYLVTEVVNDDFVLIADGDRRRLSRPKLKNVKHLKRTPDRLEAIALKLTEGKQVFDTELKRALKPFNQPNDD